MANELITRIRVAVAPVVFATIRNFQKSIEGVSKAVTSMAEVAMGAGTALAGLAKNMGEQANELYQLSQKTGVSTEKIQEWEYAATKAGVSVSAVTGDIERMTTAMDSPIPGEFNQGLFMLGVSTHKANGEMKTSSDILEDLAGRLSKMNVKRAQQWGAQAGISADTVMLLRKGKEGIAQLRAEAHKMGAIIPDNQIKAMAEFSNTVNAISKTSKALTASFVSGLTPSLMKVVRAFQEWQMRSGNLINKKLEIFGEKVGKVFEFFAKAIQLVSTKASALGKFFKPMLDALEKGNLLASLLATGLGILALSGFGKLMAIIFSAKGALVLLAVVVEELYVWFTYGWEYTGFYAIWEKLKKWWDKSTPQMKIITVLITAIATAFSGMFFASIIKASKAFQILSKAMAFLAAHPVIIVLGLIAFAIYELYTWCTKGWEATYLAKFFKWLEKEYPPVANFIKDSIRGWKELFDSCGDSIHSLWEGFQNFIEWVGNKATAVMDAFAKPINSIKDKWNDWFGDGKKKEVDINTNTTTSQTLLNPSSQFMAGRDALLQAQASIAQQMGKNKHSIKEGNNFLTQKATTLVPDLTPMLVKNTEQSVLSPSMFDATQPRMPLSPTEINNDNSKNTTTTNNNSPMNITIMAGGQSMDTILRDLQRFGNGNSINVIDAGMSGGALIQ